MNDTNDERLRVRITREGTAARVHPVDWLGPERWPIFRRAVDGARYVHAQNARFATLDKVYPILMRLRDAGFDVEMDESTTRGLQRFNAEQLTRHQQARERIERVDAEMRAATGMYLFNYQKFGAMWLTGRHAALLADEPGTGKTVQTLVALPAGAPVIVICPATLKDTWRSEARKFRPQLTPQVLAGRDGWRWPKPGEFLTINYDVLPDVHDREGVKGRRCDGFLPPLPCKGCREELVLTAEFVGTKKLGHKDGCTGFKDPFPCPGCHPLLDQCHPGTAVVFDEGHKAKGQKSARGIRARALSGAVRAKDGWSWVLTGTPLENNPKELWFVMQLAGIAEMCFGDYETFFDRFNGAVLDTGGCTWGLPDEDVVERIQRGALRRMRKDVLPELPTKMHQVLEVEVDRKALGPCDEFMKRYGGLDRISSLIEKESFDFSEMASARMALATAKIPALFKLIKELESPKDPMIVYSMHRAPVDAVERLPGWAAIHGGIPVEKRNEIVERFQAGKLRGLGLMIQSGGVGLTLTRAALGIVVDQSYKPTEMDQAEDRMVRISQTRGVRFIVLQANHPLDRRVTEIIMKKRALIAAAVDASSVADDAPTDAGREIEEQLRAIQREITSGKAVRRMAVADEETEALVALHTLHFARRSDEKLAEDLAEEAESIGLSDAQWALAVRVAQRGTKKLDRDLDGSDRIGQNSPPPSVRSRETHTQDDEGEVVEEVLSMGKKPTADDKLDPKVEMVVTLIRTLTDEQRAELFDMLGDESEFCLGCGIAGTPKQLSAHECPADDEDEDEDGDGDEEEAKA